MIPKLYDKTGETLIGELTECSRGIAIEERNGMLEIEIDYQLCSPYSESIERGNIIVADVNDYLKEQLFRIYKVTKNISGRFTIYANHISYDLLRDYTEGLTGIEDTCEYCLNEIFRSSQFSQHFTGYSDIEPVQTFTITPRCLYEAIIGKSGSIIDTFGNGAEILRDNYNLHVLNNRGNDNGVTIEYGSNLTGLDYEEDETGLITVIRATATYVDEFEIEQTIHTYVTSPRASEYETLFIGEIDFSDKFQETIPTIEKLKTLAENYFENNECDIMSHNYKIEFVPLSKCAGYEDIEDSIKLCDTVTIIDPRYNLNAKVKVIKTTYNFLKDRYDSMELGKFKDTSLGVGEDVQEQLDDMLNTVSGTTVKLQLLENRIYSEVADLEAEVETNKTMINQTSEQIQTVATDMNGKYTELKQTVDSIDLTGMVTFSDLSTEGQTTINGANIKTGTITADQIASGAITADKITSGSITADQLADNTITADQIANGTITGTLIANGTITTNEIKAGTITSSDIATGTITADNIASGTITTNEIASGTITANNIATGTITANELASDAIRVGNISQATSQSKAYINFFNNMSIDGSSGAFRFQYDTNNYLYVSGGQFQYYSSSGGSSSPTWAFYGGTSTQTMYTNSNTFTVNSSGMTVSSGGFNSDGTSNLDYIKCTGNINTSVVYSGRIENSGYLYTDKLDDYSGSGITMYASLNGNGTNLGYSGSKFYQLSAQYVWGDNGSVSDEKFKENIRYVKENRKKEKSVLAFDPGKIKKQNKISRDFDKEELITEKDFYDFVKDELDICEYNYIQEEGQKIEEGFKNKIGLIANDYADSKIGSKIVGYTSEGFYAINTNNLLFVTLGALQHEIEKRDSQISELIKRLDNIEKGMKE